MAQGASAAYLRQAVQLALALHAVPRALAALTSRAALAAQMGDPVRAIELAALCVHHPASQKDVQRRGIRFLAALAEQLPPEVMAAAQARGRAKTLEEVAKSL
jgi:hypothetical protein